MWYWPAALRRSTSAIRCLSQRSCHLVSTALGSYGVPLIALSRFPVDASRRGRPGWSSWREWPAATAWIIHETGPGGWFHPGRPLGRSALDRSIARRWGGTGREPARSGKGAGGGVLLEQAVAQAVDEAARLLGADVRGEL